VLVPEVGQEHPERGEAILLRLAEDVKDLATIESKPNLDGRNMIMMLTPIKTQESGKAPAPENSPPEADAQAEAAGATAAS
jgi:translation initiation factor IF-3